MYIASHPGYLVMSSPCRACEGSVMAARETFEMYPQEAESIKLSLQGVCTTSRTNPREKYFYY